MPRCNKEAVMPNAETMPRIQEIRIRSGKTIAVRPVTPEDEPLLEEFFDRVSDEDRRFRFLSAHNHLDHAQLAPMVEVDHFRTESFIAFDEATDTVIGHALLACDNALDTAEVAVAVCSSWRGMGVGWALLDVLAEAARHRGLRRVIMPRSSWNARRALSRTASKAIRIWCCWKSCCANAYLKAGGKCRTGTENPPGEFPFHAHRPGRPARRRRGHRQGRGLLPRRCRRRPQPRPAPRPPAW
jgi:GNAT superfamily N-acetyltransferase